MAHILSIGLILTTALMAHNQESTPANVDCWTTAEIKKAFVKPVFHDKFVDGKINRLARHPWNRAQSAIAWYMAVSANEALKKSLSAAQKAELDKALGRFHTELAEALQR